MTFTLDEETVGRINRAAGRLNIAKSQVVREAVRDYSERIGRLSEAERLKMLRIFDEVVPRIPYRTIEEVEKELNGIRQARRSSGRRSGSIPTQ